ncbi:hypothetical protein P170DRAFT_430063 [Aspergillus steynii IBT 23096]|uniref:Uncharacterized protein n=1 Tax=Aspergillus steynii IBT 23096 TaxID=1392250 RepID=A0A2I2FU32_9EURO|nr:uncharacterized protein P170DRAFT_430063 [Aspergillus steynii IBT 23096]PLB44149.1 hypothetical protein P170DRAFT_430063 [Aspergillus steynii IBT 23096]
MDTKTNKKKVQDRRCVPFGSKTWLDNLDHLFNSCHKVSSKIAAEAEETKTKPFSQELVWTPGITLTQKQKDNNSLWPYFGTPDPGNPKRIPPDHVRLSDWWVAAVMTNEDISARQRGLKWSFDFEITGQPRIARMPRGDPVIVERNGKCFIPVVKLYYLLCGQNYALRFPWIVNYPDKTRGFVWTNLFQLPPAMTARDRPQANFPSAALKTYTKGALLTFDLESNSIKCLQEELDANNDDTESVSTKEDERSTPALSQASPGKKEKTSQATSTQVSPSKKTKVCKDKKSLQAPQSQQTPANSGFASLFTSPNLLDPRIVELQEEVKTLETTCQSLRIDVESSNRVAERLKNALDVAQKERDIAISAKDAAVQERDQARHMAESTSNKLNDALINLDILRADNSEKDKEIERLLLQLFQATPQTQTASQSDYNVSATPTASTPAEATAQSSSISDTNTTSPGPLPEKTDPDKLSSTNDATQTADETNRLVSIEAAIRRLVKDTNLRFKNLRGEVTRVQETLGLIGGKSDRSGDDEDSNSPTDLNPVSMNGASEGA